MPFLGVCMAQRHYYIWARLVFLWLLVLSYYCAHVMAGTQKLLTQDAQNWLRKQSITIYNMATKKDQWA